MQLERVSPFTRTVLALFAMFAAWQVYWLYRAAVSVEGFIPTIQQVGWWIAAWGLVGACSLIAVISGLDLAARAALGTMAVVSTIGAVTIHLSGVPIGREFYAFGQAVLWAGSSFVLLLAPLHTFPAHDSFPTDLDEITVGAEIIGVGGHGE